LANQDISHDYKVYVVLDVWLVVDWAAVSSPTSADFQIPFLLNLTCLQTTLRCTTNAWYSVFPYWSIIALLVSTACKSLLPHTVCSSINPTKIDLIWFGARTTLSKITASYRSLSVGSSVVQSCETVRDLGSSVVWLGTVHEDTLAKLSASVITSDLYIIISLVITISVVYAILQHCLSQSTLTMLVTSLILQRLDYCNSVLAGLPASSMIPLQQVQNAAARSSDSQSGSPSMSNLYLIELQTVWGKRLLTNITPALQQLHWLPVYYRIQYKIIIIIIIQHLYSAIMSYADTEALVAPVKSE